MKPYAEMTAEELTQELEKLKKEYKKVQAMDIQLNMSRGIPCIDQLDLSMHMMDVLDSSSDLTCEDGTDCRNYGQLTGIEEARELLGDMMENNPKDIIIYGNSSLNVMFDTISRVWTHGVMGNTPWCRQPEVKFLCPVPGYDRHFGITGYYGFEMILVPMSEDGPDMDMVEELVKDESVKGIWCVPKYSNPQGVTYSDETVRRLANLKPAAKDFRIMWDNAYCVHDISDTPDELLNIYDECVKAGNEDLPLLFCSTSKITFPGAGVAAMAASPANMKVLRERYNFEVISYDKLNMLRHVKYFGDYNGVLQHMKKHKAVLAPKFGIVLSTLKNELAPVGVGKWTDPNGGYFVSIDVMNGTAKRVVQLCREAGLVLTGAGATYPNGFDPNDSNIRIAPSFPPNDELQTAMDLFCVCVKLAACEKLLNK